MAVSDRLKRVELHPVLVLSFFLQEYRTSLFMKQFFGKKSRNTLATIIVASLALHIAALIIFGAVKFVSAVLREEKVFEAALTETTPQKEPKPAVNIRPMKNSVPPPRPPVIVVNNPKDLEIPALDIDVNVESSAVFGRGGGGFGGGLAQVREMAVNFKLTDFGYTGQTEGTLEATLIDLKRDKSGKDIGSFGAYIRQRIRDFTAGSWRVSDLTQKYYTAEKKLYGSYWIIPNGSAALAPKAFGVEDEFEPKSIAALYKGTYTPTENMEMRFCGVADDVLIVRLGSKIVLNGSVDPGYCNEFEHTKNGFGPTLAEFTRPVRYGDWIELKRGQDYDLSILIAEVPGGFFGCFLFYQTKQSDEFRVFSTKPLTVQEKKKLRVIHEDVAKAL